MVVKEKRGRRRYVAFSLNQSIPKYELERGISAAGQLQIKVIQCAGGWCILRCEPGSVDRCRNAVAAVCPGAVSKATSGNLLTLRRRYPILWETRPRYIAFTVSADGRSIARTLEELGDDDGPSLKFCGSGYAIVKCALRDSDRTVEMMKKADPSSEAFLSSYKSRDLKKKIADMVPELRPVLLTR